MSHRDLALCAVAALVVVALTVMAFVQPPAAPQLITGAVAIGTTALGRLSGAPATKDPA